MKPDCRNNKSCGGYICSGAMIRVTLNDTQCRYSDVSDSGLYVGTYISI